MSIEWEIEELACVVCGKTEEETEQIVNDSVADDMLNEKYGVDLETYCAIVKDLLRYTPTVKSAFLGKDYHAFVKKDYMIVKQEA